MFVISLFEKKRINKSFLFQAIRSMTYLIEKDVLSITSFRGEIFQSTVVTDSVF